MVFNTDNSLEQLGSVVHEGSEAFDVLATSKGHLGVRRFRESHDIGRLHCTVIMSLLVLEYLYLTLSVQKMNSILLGK